MSDCCIVTDEIDLGVVEALPSLRVTDQVPALLVSEVFCEPDDEAEAFEWPPGEAFEWPPGDPFLW